MFQASKKRIVPLAFLAAAFIGLGTASDSYAAGGLGLSFKLGGGIGYLFNGAGEIEKTRLGMESYTTDWVEPGYTSTLDWKKLSILPDFRFEAVLRISDSLGIGLGTSYL